MTVAEPDQPGKNHSAVEDRVAAAIATLSASDGQWQVVRSCGGMTATRPWPDGTTDTVILLSPSTAYAVRDNPDGRGSPWSVTGSAEHVVRAAAAVKAPGTPGAPHGAGRGLPRGDWR